MDLAVGEPMLGLFERHLLSLIVFMPLGSALALLLLEVLVGVLRGARTHFSDSAWKIYALFSSAIGLALSIELWNRFDPSAEGIQLVEHAPWLGDWGIHYYVGVDGISLLLVGLTSFLLPIAWLASWSQTKQRVKHYAVFLLGLQTSLLGAFLSLNLVAFYVFSEAALVPLFFLVGIWGGAGRTEAALKYFTFGGVGSAILLIAILVAAGLHYQHFGVVSFDFIGFGDQPGMVDTPIPIDGAPWWATQHFLFAALLLGFAVKIPLVPLHSWLPDAQVAAPTAGAVMLSAVGLKLGAYGLLRFALPLLSDAAVEWAPWLRAAAAASIVYTAALALVQANPRRLLAYASLCSMGWVALGLFSLNAIGLEGALFQMVSHGLWVAALLILLGVLEERRPGRPLTEIGGLREVMPMFSSALTLAVLSAMGLPLLAGFIADWLVLLAAFGTTPRAAATAALSIPLLAVPLLGILRQLLFGAPSEEVRRRLWDLRARESFVAAALAVPLVWMGVHPVSFLNPIDRSVNELIESIGTAGEEAVK